MLFLKRLNISVVYAAQNIQTMVINASDVANMSGQTLGNLRSGDVLYIETHCLSITAHYKVLILFNIFTPKSSDNNSIFSMGAEGNYIFQILISIPITCKNTFTYNLYLHSFKILTVLCV